jgi:leucyl aminopeptidase
MKITLADPTRNNAPTDLLIEPVFEGEIARSTARNRDLSSLDAAVRGLLLRAAAEESFRGASEQLFAFATQEKLPARRIVLLGLGKREDFTPEVLRQAAARAVKSAPRVSAKRATLRLPHVLDLAAELRAAAEGALLGAYRFDKYKSGGPDQPGHPLAELVILVAGAAGAGGAALKRELAFAEATAKAVTFARDLVNEPASEMTPSRLASEARALGKRAGLRVTVLSRAQIAKLRMGMFLGVSQGSAEEPQLIQVAYEPRGARKRSKAGTVAIVGKAITFDSGGLSLKTSEQMMDMKTDMAGSAAALGAMQLCAVLKPDFPVHAYMGACENMPDGRAYKLGDVLRARNGKTVEITNTDAEGRLVLGDMLTYAAESKPAVLVDLATLTGACMVALGHWTMGAFGRHEGAMAEVLGAAGWAGEDAWRLPLTPWVKDTLKSDIADMRNAGERFGGAIAAAHFLSDFVGDTPWVHLDIAGPAFLSKDRGYLPKGATGVGVRTLGALIRRRMERDER